MQSFLEGIINKKQVAILIDPEKIQSIDQLDYLVRKIEFSKASYIFVGGSTVNPLDFSDVISRIKSTTSIPVIIFPGSSNQVSNDADGILLLNLISGRNPDFLITHHVQAAEFLDKSNLEIISTSYLLIDGGSQSSVAYVSQTTPIPHHNHSIVYKTALAGKQIGHKVIFLDAGSGAQNAVQPAQASRASSSAGALGAMASLSCASTRASSSSTSASATFKRLPSSAIS